MANAGSDPSNCAAFSCRTGAHRITNHRNDLIIRHRKQAHFKMVLLPGEACMFELYNSLGFLTRRDA
jgi:hypothetical protein